MSTIYQKLVGHFETQQATADALGVDQSAVSGWVRGAFKMSPGVAVRAEKATDGLFTRQQLCPSFPGDEVAA